MRGYHQPLLLVILLAACSTSPASPSPTSALPVPTPISADCKGMEDTLQQACTSRATGLHYWLSLPAQDMLSSGEKPPLILYLHGFSHSGSQMALVLGGGLAVQIEWGRELPALVVSPQCPNGYIWTSEKMVEWLSSLVDEVVAQYGADPRRVYLTGFSMGGDGVWALGIAHPEQFAALAPVSSWYWKPESACKLKEIPVWVYQSEKDEIVAPRFAQDMVRALENCDGNVKLTLFPKAGHEESSYQAYETDELYTWMLAQASDR